MKKETIPVIVDEMNLIHQLHRINVHGVSWPAFFRALSRYTKANVTSHFACANIDDQKESFYSNRKQYFGTLRERGVNILEGIAITNPKQQRVEKGVDVLVSLQIYKEAIQGVKDIIVCSADGDLAPAIIEAQQMGARVHIVISDYAPGHKLVDIADKVISLETIIEIMIEMMKKAVDKTYIRFKENDKPYIYPTTDRCFKKSRRGVCYA